MDIKTEAQTTFEAVEAALAPLAPLLRCGLTNTSSPDVSTPAALSVVISGNRPTVAMYNGPIASPLRRCSTLDARRSELAAWNGAPRAAADGYPIYTLLSDVWPLPGGMDASALNEAASLAHRYGLLARYWSTPEDAALWNRLISSGIDIIGTDELRPLADFLTEAQIHETCSERKRA